MPAILALDPVTDTFRFWGRFGSKFIATCIGGLDCRNRNQMDLESVDLPVGAAWKLDTQTLMPVMDQPGVILAHLLSCTDDLIDVKG